MTPEQQAIQTWNDAVETCTRAAWAEVQAMEAEAANGLPNPARIIVRAISGMRKSGDDRQPVLNWNPDDPNPCRDCTPETCEWWGVCPHTPTSESKEAD